ncbi:hypothetical protein BS50DRAFT_3477 [Corynespora cassiicola Philippines]|uniref:Uncharacterized protein n=1 Tax=Corynespora cassiicola Philippines TaxID=1448308 RepID=A0A2T2P8B3_CORCC|nr:hypothetical protein BS50DRAFT_3477 [Corynespora cassiicola Philippines]
MPPAVPLPHPFLRRKKKERGRDSTMGNTISLAPNILYFDDPIATSRARFVATLPLLPSLHIYTHPHPHTPAPRPLYAHRACTAPPRTFSPRPAPPLDGRPEISCFKIPRAKRGHVLAILRTLCTTLRVRGPPILHVCWEPKALFHVCTSSEERGRASILCVLLEARFSGYSEGGDEGMTGAHSFLHLVEPVWVAQGFDEVLGSFVRRGIIERVGKIGSEGIELKDVIVNMTLGPEVKAEAGRGDADHDSGGVENERTTKTLEGLFWCTWMSIRDESEE